MRIALAISLAFAALLTGCINPHVTLPGATDNHFHSELPPLPPGAGVTPQSSYRMPALRTSLVEPQPTWPTLRVAWDTYTDPVDGFRVYHGTTLNQAAWTPMGETTNCFFDFQSSQFGFVGVKAFRNGIESGWGTSGYSE